MVAIRCHTMLVSVWRLGSDWCVASTLLSRSLRSVLGSTPEPPLNHAGLGHLATSRSNNEYYCRLMHFYHYLWQCTEHVSYFESYHRIV